MRGKGATEVGRPPAPAGTPPLARVPLLALFVAVPLALSTTSKEAFLLPKEAAAVTLIALALAAAVLRAWRGPLALGVPPLLPALAEAAAAGAEAFFSSLTISPAGLPPSTTRPRRMPSPADASRGGGARVQRTKRTSAASDCICTTAPSGPSANSRNS